MEVQAIESTLSSPGSMPLLRTRSIRDLEVGRTDRYEGLPNRIRVCNAGGTVMVFNKWFCNDAEATWAMRGANNRFVRRL